MAVEDDFAQELGALHRGRGLRRPTLDPGPAIRSALYITEANPPAQARDRVVAALKAAAATLPHDLQVVFLHACALSSGHPTLGERLREAGEAIQRDERTVRRRLAQANESVATYLQRGAGGAGDEGWFLETMETTLDLRGERPISTTYRTLCPTKQGVTVLRERFSIPHRPGDPLAPEVRVVRGGELSWLRQESPSVWALEATLDHALAVGELHEVGIEVELPDRSVLRPYSVAVPMSPIRTFTTTVLFGDPPAASRVWRVEGLLPAGLDDGVAPDDAVDPHLQPEIREEFTGMRLGLAYGLCWLWA